MFPHCGLHVQTGHHLKTEWTPNKKSPARPGLFICLVFNAGKLDFSEILAFLQYSLIRNTTGTQCPSVFCPEVSSAFSSFFVSHIYNVHHAHKYTQRVQLFSLQEAVWLCASSHYHRYLYTLSTPSPFPCHMHTLYTITHPPPPPSLPTHTHIRTPPVPLMPCIHTPLKDWQRGW